MARTAFRLGRSSKRKEPVAVLLAPIWVCVQVSERVETRSNIERAFVAGLGPESRHFYVFSCFCSCAGKQSQVSKGFGDAFPHNFSILAPLMSH